jgi:outer membrane protein assembly factor BamB
MMRLANLLALTIAVCLICGPVDGADWPRWRGPQANGISEETGWLTEALTGELDRRWELSIGNGWSAVATSGGLVYTMGNSDEKDTVFCVREDTGKEVWRFSYSCPEGNYPGPRSTPVVDGDRVYTLSRAGHLHCLDARTGDLKWKKDIVSELGAESPRWGFAGSALIAGKLLVLNAGTSGIALDKLTGTKVWAGQPGTGGYATPVVYEMGGQQRVLIFGESKIFSLDLATGKQLWSSDWKTRYDVNAPDPVKVDGSGIFISSGYGTGCALLDISADKPKMVWQSKELSSQFGSPVLIDGNIYGPDGSAGRSKSSLKCVDAKSGKVLWSQPLGFTSLIAAGNRLIVLGEDGVLYVVAARPDAYQELARVTALTPAKKEVCWTAPVLSNGQLYLRTSLGRLLAVGLAQSVSDGD